MTQYKEYDVVIVGGGITGSALLYVLAQYTNIARLAIIEKYHETGQVNSHPKNNSQTLHFGDIETNYTLEKATKVKEAAEIVRWYLHTHAEEAFKKSHKMVLAVGEKEVGELERRYDEFKALYPKLRKIGREEIAAVEPKVVEGRDPTEKILALVTEEGYAVDYKRLSDSFVREAQKSGKIVDVFLGTMVDSIHRNNDGYTITTRKTEFAARAVAVMAGPHSLVFARSLNYGKNFGILPVAGSFYCAENVLSGKVYTMQIKQLPFAAVHGDPDVEHIHITRFGPTAKVLPLLERHHYRTVLDFIKTSVWSFQGILSLAKIISDPVIFSYVMKNLSYDIPFLGKYLFLKNVKKIIPSMRYSDITYGKGLGGIRPQVVNVEKKTLQMGESEIVGDKILFNITPSPGASVCLKNAEQDAIKLVNFLGKSYFFDEKRWCDDTGSTMSQCQE